MTTGSRGSRRQPEDDEGDGESVLAVLAGAVVAMVLISAFEAIGGVLFPPPPGLDLADHEGMRQHIASLPVGAFLQALGGWALGAGCGARLAGRARLMHGLIVGALFLLASVLTMLMLPHPVWMWVGAVVALTGCSYSGARAAAASVPPARATV